MMKIDEKSQKITKNHEKTVLSVQIQNYKPPHPMFTNNQSSLIRVFM